MTDDFARYERLKDEGCTALQVARVAIEDGLDRIATIRVLRSVYGLSMSEVKRVLHSPDPWKMGQKVEVGGTVYWEGGAPDEGLYSVESQVVGIDGDAVLLRDRRIYRCGQGGTEADEQPANDAAVHSMSITYFELPLAERLERALRVVAGTQQVPSTR